MTLLYIMCKFGEFWSSNSGVYEGESCTLLHTVFSFFKINISNNLSQQFISPNFYRMVVRTLTTWSSFSIAQGTLPWQPIFKGKIGWIDLYSPLFVALAFRNGLQYRYSDFSRFVCDDLATLCVNLVNFGPVTTTYTKVKYVHKPRRLIFLLKRPLDKLSQYPQDRFSPNFHIVVGIWSQITDLTPFPVAQKTLPWQPSLRLKWGKSPDSPSFVTLALLNGVMYRNYDFKRFICGDLATLCKNLINFVPVTPAFKKGKDVHPSSISSATARLCGDQ